MDGVYLEGGDNGVPEFDTATPHASGRGRFCAGASHCRPHAMSLSAVVYLSFLASRLGFASRKTFPQKQGCGGIGFAASPLLIISSLG